MEVSAFPLTATKSAEDLSKFVVWDSLYRCSYTVHSWSCTERRLSALEKPEVINLTHRVEP